MKKELLFEIDGFEVYKNSTYVVRDKEDLSAPTGLVKLGVTKLPSDGVSDSFPCRYVAQTSKIGVWDTGFYEFSPCYKGIDRDIVKEKVDRLQEGVVKPYLELAGEETILDHKNNAFWDSVRFRVFSGQTLHTDNPEDTLTLYFALLNRELTPKNKKGDARYSDSSYIVVDITKDIKRKDEKAAIKFKAIGIFEELLRSDKNRLLAVLAYNNVPMPDKIDDDGMRGIFQQYIDGQQQNNRNAEAFLRVVEDTRNETGRAVVEIYIKLNKLSKTSNRVTRTPGGIFFFDEYEIGADLRSAATNIAKNSDLEVVKKEILFEE